MSDSSTAGDAQRRAVRYLSLKDRTAGECCTVTFDWAVSPRIRNSKSESFYETGLDFLKSTHSSRDCQHIHKVKTGQMQKNKINQKTKTIFLPETGSRTSGVLTQPAGLHPPFLGCWCFCITKWKHGTDEVLWYRTAKNTRAKRRVLLVCCWELINRCVSLYTAAHSWLNQHAKQAS